MEVKTYRAKSLQEALQLVRTELGPDAAVLHTREVREGLFQWLSGSRRVEVTASNNVNVPSRFSRSAIDPALSDVNLGDLQSDDLQSDDLQTDGLQTDGLELGDVQSADFQSDALAHHASPYGGPIENTPVDNELADKELVDKELVDGESVDGELAADEFRLGGEAPLVGRTSGGALPAHDLDYRAKFRDDLRDELSDLNSMVEQLSQKTPDNSNDEMARSLFQLFTDLIDAEVNEELARELIERVRCGASSRDLEDSALMKSRLARLIEESIDCGGPIRVTPGRRKLVALVGPTGVGKTTTIAKLAASFHLRERHRVGLITVDTYRIAAVDQLRTYADIIDLPMEVVSTPREMRAAANKMADLDLILMDTAGRSPRDEVRIQELKSMLQEANADEVHLVLSSVTSASSMKKTAERFADVGVTSLLLTKLDEATGLGNLLPVLRASKLPLSYVTNGQNVPDDIAAADCRRLARVVLGMESIK